MSGLTSVWTFVTRANAWCRVLTPGRASPPSPRRVRALHPVGMMRPGQQRVGDLGRSAARVGGRVAAAVEQQRAARAGGAEPGHPAGDQVVVTGFVNRFDR